MKKLAMYFLAATVLGLFVGAITWLTFGLSTENWEGAGWMFLGMIGYVYLAGIGLGILFAFDRWING